MFGSLMKNINFTFTVKREILDRIKSWLLTKNKKKFSFSFNDIINGYYENELYRFEKFNELFFNGVLKNKKKITTKEEAINVAVKAIFYLNEMEKNVINFQQSYNSFITVLQEYNKKINWNEDGKLCRALFDDINNVLRYEEDDKMIKGLMIDNSLNEFNEHFNQTMFRNYVYIFSEELVRRYNHAFLRKIVVDLIVNNRKMNTLVNPNWSSKKRGKEEKKGILFYEENIEDIEKSIKEELHWLWIKNKNNVDFLQLVLSSFKKKVYSKWASIFSNQLRTFFFKEQKLIKKKETKGGKMDNETKVISTDALIDELEYEWDYNISLIDNKPKSLKELNAILQNIISINTDEVSGYDRELVEDLAYLNYDKLISRNLYEALFSFFWKNRTKYIHYFNQLIKNKKWLFNQIYFYIPEIIDRLAKEDKDFYTRHKELFDELHSIIN